MKKCKMKTYAKHIKQPFVIDSDKADEFLSHSNKEDIDNMYKMCNVFEEVINKNRGDVLHDND